MNEFSEMTVKEFSTLFMPHQAMLACILSSVSCMSLESSSDGGLCVNLKLAFFYVTRSTHLYWLRIASNLFLFQHCLSS